MKILHLEDDPRDARLVSELLSDAFPDTEIVLADSEKSYREALARGDYDVILSDFSLPGFDGIEALSIARNAMSDTPFIFLSGNIGEDRAIEAVRSGAHDYVLKDRMKRLVTAIRRAVKESHDRKRSQKIESERQRLAATLENSPDFVGLAEPDGTLLFLNRAARNMLGLPDGPLPHGLRAVDTRPPEVHRAVKESFAIASCEGVWSGETILLSQDGRKIPVSQVLIAHRRADGSLEYFSTVMRDLTAQKQIDALVQGQNRLLEMIASGEPLTDLLTALLQFLEGQHDEILCSILLVEEGGKRLRHSAAPRLAHEFVKAIDGVPIGPSSGACGTAAFRREAVIIEDLSSDPLSADYREICARFNLRACWSTPIFDTHHHLVGTFAVYTRQPGSPNGRHRQLIDVGTHIASICLSHHYAQRRLREQTDILDKASDAIVATDLNDRVTFWNKGAERIFGWLAGDAIGRREVDLFPPESVSEIEGARLATNERGEWSGDIRLHDRQGNAHILDCRVTILRDENGQPQGRLSVAADITEKKRMEEQFFRAQRLESLGMLSAGIAHDLNNILAPILLAAPMLRDTTSDPNDLRMISTLEKSATRGAALVRQILGFAHGADGEHRVFQPKHLLRDIANFVQETFPKSVRLYDSIPSNLCPIKGNPTQLHQVLLNLCVNARDAMPNGGTLTLRAENCTLDEIAAAEIENGRAGSFVVFHIQDTGTGIPPEVFPHIWEPFFTTKSTDKGTGLGLSTVRGIVESHAGFVTVNTIPGQGTTFRVYLEAVETPAGQINPTTVSSHAVRGSGELILVVDDESSIRNVTAAMLARHGYRVLTAADGAEAIALFAPRSKEIKVVITDVSMPNLDGVALAGIIHRLNPGTKLVLVTGLNTDSTQELTRQNIAYTLVVKPFPPETLLTTVHEILRSPPNPPP
jgi:PAS domain S-box-containing protein